MKILSVNLWFSNYQNKTLAQLSSFRHYNYITHAATIVNHHKHFSCIIYNVTDLTINPILKEEFYHTLPFANYLHAFKFLFQYCQNEHYDLIYIRRLMSKLLFAIPYIKSLSLSIPIIYELPTYPFDTTHNILYQLRDIIETLLYKMINRYIKLTVVVLRKNIELPLNWISFHNGIDISNYTISNVPELSDKLNFITIANIARWHKYDRMLDAMKSYHGNYQLHFTIISPPSKDYDSLKDKVHRLHLESQVTFYDKMTLKEISQIAKEQHIGVGQLSSHLDGSSQINTLKTKDYCALGLPFFTTCHDTSFPIDFKYSFITPNMDDELCLENIIKWYENIYSNPNYKVEMYKYAKENLQFYSLVDEIEKRIR